MIKVSSEYGRHSTTSFRIVKQSFRLSSHMKTMFIVKKLFGFRTVPISLMAHSKSFQQYQQHMHQN